ncbi:hypothetical protein BBW65_02100 [Helicobacter enhydrae]|uniref:Autotransporter domain-containing protein n=1 Tax=Helicobacter enhydrae TaxID=222136 RepID=A0A1B1U4I8_9HELI|nr:autotransporter outer membrane beta-barrel domain-containing protein [Helicobacter enhydrae]ANV97670.1 hypothetical protein BBW65_02100 [Helicobacter enhydrae]
MNSLNSPLFKPLIATSLALALSVSVASAGDCDGSASAICWSTTNGTDFKQFTGLKFGQEGGYNKLQFATPPASGITISDFTLKFTQTGGNGSVGSTPEASVGGNNAQLKLINKGNGLQLGNGLGTLTINFGNHNRNYNAKKAILNFEGTTTENSSKIAFKGNIRVIPSYWYDKVEATFKGDMIGNIDLYNNANNNTIKTIFTFQDGAKLKGNLTTKLVEGQQDGQNLIFEGGSGGIEGNIQTYGRIGNTGSTANDNVDVNITFKTHNEGNTTNTIKKGSRNTGTGEIRAEAGLGGQWLNNARNRILFENNGKIGEGTSNRIDIVAYADRTYTAQAHNLIQFKKQATLYLGVLRAVGLNTTNHRNILSLENNTDATNILDITTIISDGSKGRNYIGKGFLTLGSGGTAKDLAINTNAIDNPSATNIAKGKLTTQSIVSKSGSKNTILIEEIDVSNGIFATGANSNNTIFISKGTDNTIGTNGITNAGETSGGSGLDYAIYTAANGANSITLEASANLTIKKKIETVGNGNTTFNLNGTNSTLTLEGNTNTITTLNNASTASTLKLGKASGTTSETTIGGITNGENLTIQFLGDTATLKLGGTNNTIKALDLQATTNTLNITSGKTTITDPVNRDGSKTFNVAFSGDNSTLTLKGNKNHITTLKLDGSATKATIDIASDKYPNPNTPAGNTRNFNLLEIGTNNGEGLTASNLTFKVFVDPLATQGSSTIGGETTGASGTYGVAHSDRIVIHSATTAGTPLKENLVVIVDPEKYNGIEYGADTGTEETQRVRNIAVATVKNGSDDKPLVKFEAKHSDIGGEAVTIELREAKTNQYGKLQGEKGYTTYFLGKIISLGVTRSTQKAVASALAINYDLYVANFNSLNKRMGELRDNTNSQGIWARVFGGLQESTFGAKLHTQYISTQAGYDYALNLEGARNYLGLAFSYINSTGTSGDEDPIDELYPTSLSNVQSNGAEVALYNSYVSDMGIYNDTIAKFSYITSDFKLSNSVKDSQTNNLGFTLSNEVGYRFILGEKQDYFIDPQLEIGLGYLNQSNFIANLKALTGRINELKANQNYILLARTRAGASFGKKIVEQGKNISLYAGAFYEYDFIDGGSNKITTTRIQHTNPALESNGRVVLNLGTNLELNQSTRVYMDIEKSFGDKLRTHLQFNLGGRYSF